MNLDMRLIMNMNHANIITFKDMTLPEIIERKSVRRCSPLFSLLCNL